MRHMLNSWYPRYDLVLMPTMTGRDPGAAGPVLGPLLVLVLVLISR